jgi:hypothetical protein
MFAAITPFNLVSNLSELRTENSLMTPQVNPPVKFEYSSSITSTNIKLIRTQLTIRPMSRPTVASSLTQPTAPPSHEVNVSLQPSPQYHFSFRASSSPNLHLLPHSLHRQKSYGYSPSQTFSAPK